ncbi:MAG: hypothetical protein AAF462_08685 [Thermodesulfobacteriota bacterium]
MRAIVIAFSLLFILSGYSQAQNQEKKASGSQQIKTPKAVKLQGGIYSRMYINMLRKVQNLDLDDNAIDNINKTSKQNSIIIMNQEVKTREYQKQFMKELDSDEFNPTELKRLSLLVQSSNLKASNYFVDSVDNLRMILGQEKFAKLLPITKVDRNVLVQFRKGRTHDPLIYKKNGPQRPQAPADNK